ncbi:cell division protein Cdc14 [Scheffersomyces amazonensis]|uniref:cell division protein Cdc14 n=1 Tax=Scheffersomyces amazonensis TaxID=1078765 RepID=UPI00315DC80E
MVRMKIDRIDEIIDLLGSTDIEDITLGINSLDEFLGQNLQSIVEHFDTSSTKSSNGVKLTSFDNKNILISSQDSFQYNLVSALLGYYKVVNRDLSKIDIDTALLANRLLQGLLLIHPNSRKLFHRPSNMRVILELLEKSEISLGISLISTLIHILLKDFTNFRVFEANNGCSIIIKRFKLSSFDINQKQTTYSTFKSKRYNQQDLNFKIIEFLLFYLIDERRINTNFKTLEQKSNLFRKDFPEIDDLIDSLNELNDLQS